MDIFSNLNLNRNTIQNATLTGAVLGNNTETIEGGIKYSGGTLQYYDGSHWQAVGTGTPTINNVNGLFKIYTGSTYPSPQNTSNIVPVNAKYNGTNSSTNSGDRLQINGDGKGKLSLSSTIPSGSTASGTYSINTDIVQILYANIYVENPVNTSTNYILDHPFDSDNLLINTYFAGEKESSVYGLFRLIQCDVTIEKSTTGNNFKVIINVDRIPEAGVLKVVVYGGEQYRNHPF